MGKPNEYQAGKCENEYTSTLIIVKAWEIKNKWTLLKESNE
jgi:hypothetical protein